MWYCYYRNLIVLFCDNIISRDGRNVYIIFGIDEEKVVLNFFISIYVWLVYRLVLVILGCMFF